MNGGGWWAERDWDRWDRRNVLVKLKIHTKFHLETMGGKDTLGDLGLEEMLMKT